MADALIIYHALLPLVSENMPDKKPGDLTKVVDNTHLMAGSWLLYWFLRGALFSGALESKDATYAIVEGLKHAMVEGLLLALLLLIVLTIFDRIRGYPGLFLSIFTFTVCGVFGTIFIVYELVPFMQQIVFSPSPISPDASMTSLFTRTLIYLLPLATIILAFDNLFLLLTSDSLNSYLGTDTIFPIRKEKTKEA